jgi:hypothetical protein
MTIINYAFSIVKKLGALLTDEARVIIYDHHAFLVQATGGQSYHLYLNVVNFFNASVNLTSVAA